MLQHYDKAWEKMKVIAEQPKEEASIFIFHMPHIYQHFKLK
jgi:hypothetical protein